MDEDTIPEDAKADARRRVREYWSKKAEAQRQRRLDQEAMRRGENEAAEVEFHRRLP